MPDALPQVLRGLVRAHVRDMDPYRVPKKKPDAAAKLDSNESPYKLPEDVAAALAAELSKVDLNRYPAGDCRELRELIAGDLGVAAAELVFGNGSGELINFLIDVFGEPRPSCQRAAVLYPVPSFVFYRSAALAGGVNPIEVPLADDFSIDEAALDHALATERPNIALFSRPNNPTGTLWPRGLIERVATQCPDMVVVADEAYIDYGGDSMVGAVARLPNLVVLRTLSKLGLAALRIGFLYASDAITAEVEKVRPPYNVGALNQFVAVWLLTHKRDLLDERCRAVVAERDRLAQDLSALTGVRVYESHANLLLLRVGGDEARAEAVWRGLAARGVLVRRFPGVASLRGCLRVTVGTPEENRLFVQTLTEVLE